MRGNECSSRRASNEKGKSDGTSDGNHFSPWASGWVRWGKAGGMDTLPVLPELFAHIVSFLPAEDVRTVSLVCKEWASCVHASPSRLRLVDGEGPLCQPEHVVDVASHFHALAELRLNAASIFPDNLFRLLDVSPHLTCLDLSRWKHCSGPVVELLASKLGRRLLRLSMNHCHEITDTALRSLAHHSKGLTDLQVVGCPRLQPGMLVWVLKSFPRLEGVAWSLHADRRPGEAPPPFFTADRLLLRVATLQCSQLKRLTLVDWKFGAPPSLAQAIQRGICTFAVTGEAHFLQESRNCYTCGMVGESACCASCATLCHRGHDLGPVMRTGFFCDCGEVINRCHALPMLLVGDPDPDEEDRAIPAFPVLEEVVLDHCTLSDAAVAILSTARASLCHLRLVKTKISHRSLASLLATCTRLTSVDVDSQFSAKVLRTLTDHCPDLRNVSLSGLGPVREPDIVKLCRRLGPRLCHLGLGMCDNVGYPTLNILARCAKHLSYLLVTGCPGLTGNALHVLLAGCSELQELHIVDCVNASDTLFRAFMDRKTRLRVVEIRGCPKFSDVCLQDVARGCPSLRSLHLDSLPLVSSRGVHALARNCGQLELLRMVRCNGVGDRKHLRALGQGCPWLRTLDLSENSRVTSIGVRVLLRRASRLEHLSLVCCWSMDPAPLTRSVIHYGTLLCFLDLSHVSGVQDAQIRAMKTAHPCLHVVYHHTHNGRRIVHGGEHGGG